MGLLNELVYINQSFRNTVHRRKNLEDVIARSIRQIDIYKEEAKSIRILIDDMTQDHEAIREVVCDETLTAVLNRLDDHRLSLQRMELNLANYEAQLSQNYDVLSELKMKEARLKDNSTIVLTKESVKDQLQNVTTINPKTVCIGEDARGSFIRWRHENLKMTPLKNPIFNINFGQVFSFKIPDIVITAYLNGEFRITAPRNGIKHRGYNNRMIAHPHVLSYNRPCFGDYEGPIQEALQEVDLETVGTLVEMFLQSCAPEDPAGIHWYRWLFNDGLLDQHATFALYNTDHTDYKKIVRYVDREANKMQYFIVDAEGNITMHPFDDYNDLIAKSGVLENAA